jgi:uncharacterized repeat protein (TIGR03803 family)
MTRHRTTQAACLAFVLFAATANTSQAQTFTSLVSFDASNGDNPYSVLTQGADGNLYGTTSSEFGIGYGSVFQVTPSGGVTTLYSFCAQLNCPDGSYPVAGLTLASDGNFYGTTNAGGTNDHGVVFKITPEGAITTVYSFCSQTDCTDGSYPVAGLIQGSNGNLYGTTAYGGATGYGILFELTTAGKITTLYNFCSLTNCSDGAIPFGNLLLASNGSIYGTTYSGGTHGYWGTIFEVGGAGKLKTIYSFCALANCADGDAPYDGLVQGSNGNFYGTASNGGASLTACNGTGCGTAFQITAAGKYSTLYSFCAQSNCVDGALPTTGLVNAAPGSFYGTTAYGGAKCLSHGSYSGCGTIFEITAGGKFTRLHSFGGSDGSNPQAGLMQASNGIFYGTTLEGGSSTACSGGCGTVYSLSK